MLSADNLSEGERAAFEAHVGTMRALGLTYVWDEAVAFGIATSNGLAVTVGN